MKPSRLRIVAALVSALFITNASQAQPRAVKASVEWNKTITVSKTTPSIIACPFRPIEGVSPPTSALQDAEFSVLRDFRLDYVRWHLINASRQVAEIYPPTNEKTSWDFSSLDADLIRFLETTKGREPIVNFTIIPYWMFKTGLPIPHASNPEDPNLLRAKYGEATAKELVDPSGRALGDYFARIVSWYTKGGFTDERGVYHRSGYHYDLPWWGVLNEMDMNDVTPTQYTFLYDSIVEAVHKVSPNTKFVGLSLALPSLQPEFFEYFLNPKNHRPGIPLDMVAYHLYAGAAGVGGLSENETISNWQYTFFDQAAAFLSTVRYIESIRKRLSPTTRVDLDELGTLLADEFVPVPTLYWNLDGAVFAYLYVELARMGIDVATTSGIYDRPHGVPGYLPSITFMDPATAGLRAPIRVLQLLKDNFGPGDKLVSTDPSSDKYSLISGSDVALQAFVTPKGRKLLAINKRLREAEVDLAGLGSLVKVEVVDKESGGGLPRVVRPNRSVLHLGPFAVAVVDVK